jgi:hypothetical protein
MGKFSKDKGARVERDFVNRLNREGIAAKRVPLSGAMPNYKNDIVIPWLGGEIDGEIKARADGFKEIYKWIQPVKVLFIKANRKEGLAVMRLKDFAELLKMANYGYYSEMANPTGNSYYVPADWLQGARIQHKAA